MKPVKRILVCPLDWGLGHASRCIPLIYHLQKNNYEVVIAADAGPLSLLKQEFPDITSIVLPGYGIRYSKRFLALKMLSIIPRILAGIYREHQELKKLCFQHKIDLVISDNRYGCWHSELPSIFITHQLFIQSPILPLLIKSINFWFLKKYEQVWIPDVNKDFNYSGKLTHAQHVPKNVSYIGLLSRFSTLSTTDASKPEIAVCVLLSGPEPQRTMLENLLIDQLTDLRLKAVILRGLPASNNVRQNTEFISFYNHLPTKKLQKIIEASELIISRSGYCTLIDLAVLGKKAIFIPTPGQTEQEYLAAYFKENKICYSQAQSKFDLKEALAQSKNFKGFEGTSADFYLPDFA